MQVINTCLFTKKFRYFESFRFIFLDKGANEFKNTKLFNIVNYVTCLSMGNHIACTLQEVIHKTPLFQMTLPVFVTNALVV